METTQFIYDSKYCVTLKAFAFRRNFESGMRFKSQTRLICEILVRKEDIDYNNTPTSMCALYIKIMCIV